MFTVPETLEQNGLADRFNRTLVEAPRCMLHESLLPKTYWFRVIATAAFVRNVVVKERDAKSPLRKISCEVSPEKSFESLWMSSVC